MTDMHSHIMYGIDDGSDNLDESIRLLKKLKSVGFDNVMLTPHFINGSDYCSDNKEKEKIFQIIKKELNKQNIDINIYLGNEIFIDNEITSLIKEGKIETINNTNYVLIELPFHNPIINLEEILYEIKISGYIPIIAHPERYIYFQNNKKLIDKLKDDGILFQGNYYSIIGGYGKDSKKLLKYMLKKNYIDYLGTDIHHISDTKVLDEFEKIEKKIVKYAKEYYQTIKNNCDKFVK